ncbi:hypothetical protein AGMMS49921_12870 [Endomicrobiia bacterium]|nr:hypothetical protein AGMMS49921_12870 [Endomicrobiia bacterium]
MVADKNLKNQNTTTHSYTGVIDDGNKKGRSTDIRGGVKIKVVSEKKSKSIMLSAIIPHGHASIGIKKSLLSPLNSLLSLCKPIQGLITSSLSRLTNVFLPNPSIPSSGLPGSNIVKYQDQMKIYYSFFLGTKVTSANGTLLYASVVSIPKITGAPADRVYHTTLECLFSPSLLTNPAIAAGNPRNQPSIASNSNSGCKKGSSSEARNNNIARQVSTSGVFQYISPNVCMHDKKDNIKLGVSDFKVITESKREVGKTRVDLLGFIKIDKREIKVIQNGRLENSKDGLREIAIKDGTYRLGIITRPPREPELWLQNQNGRTQILAHLGDDGRWSQGCLIVPNKKDLQCLVKYVSDKYKVGEHVYLTISTSKEVNEDKKAYYDKNEALFKNQEEKRELSNAAIDKADQAYKNWVKNPTHKGLEHAFKAATKEAKKEFETYRGSRGYFDTKEDKSKYEMFKRFNNLNTQSLTTATQTPTNNVAGKSNKNNNTSQNASSGSPKASSKPPDANKASDFSPNDNKKANRQNQAQNNSAPMTLKIFSDHLKGDIEENENRRVYNPDYEDGDYEHHGKYDGHHSAPFTFTSNETAKVNTASSHATIELSPANDNDKSDNNRLLDPENEPPSSWGDPYEGSVDVDQKYITVPDTMTTASVRLYPNNKSNQRWILDCNNTVDDEIGPKMENCELIDVANKTKSKKDSGKNNNGLGDQSSSNNPSNNSDGSSNGYPSSNSIANSNPWRKIDKDKFKVDGVAQAQIYDGQPIKNNQLLFECKSYALPQMVGVLEPQRLHIH